MKDDIKEIDKVLTLAQRQMLGLLRLSMGLPLDNCLAVCKVDWQQVYAEAERQSVVGLCFAGIERLPKDRLPDMDLLMDWLGQAEYIKTQNKAVDVACREVCSMFQVSGFKSVVLKGQGLARLYRFKAESLGLRAESPSSENSISSKLISLSSYRTSGDVDLWVPEGDANKLIALARERCKSVSPKYHHVDFGKIHDVDVEVHYRPSWFYCPWRNKRFQQFCRDNAEVEITDGIAHPTLAFNRVYVLVHIYRHLFTEGIGLRQLIDYFVVLVSSFRFQDGKFWPQEKIETMQRLKELGLERFTAATMYVLKEALGIPEECLLCPPNEKDGLFLLSEIMQSGNFGHHDNRYQYEGYKKGDLNLRYAWGRTSRLFHLFKFGPLEVICSPFWKMWHMWWWMVRHGKA